MSRIPYPVVTTLSQIKQDIFAAYGPKLLKVSYMTMHAPDAYWASWRSLGIAAVETKTLDPRLKEYIILRVAYMSDSAYELHHHTSLAAQLGVGEEVFAALKTGDFSSFTPLERAVCQFATEVVRDVSPSDETLAQVREHISDERVFEIVCLIGSYMLTARIAAVGGCEPEATAVQDWSTMGALFRQGPR